MQIDVVETIRESVSYSDACRKLGFCINGTGIRKVKGLIEEFSIDISHFSDKGWYKSKYPKIIKKCPVCEKNFETQVGHPREKTTCSYGCSNHFYRSGKNNGQFKTGNNSINQDTGRSYSGGHRYICFKFWPHVCAIPGCGWDKVVEVHHIDDNHDNNAKENLIPLCPNHHRLTVINEYKIEIRKQIDELVMGRWL